MDLNLHIGEEQQPKDAPIVSGHVLNLKGEPAAKPRAGLKDEIHSEKKRSGRICIVGELPRARQGLSRLPMILAAVLTIVLLNFGQLYFLGQQQGSESLALAGEAFTTLGEASHAIASGDPGADAVLFEQASLLFEAARKEGDFLLAQNTDWITPPKQVRSFRNLIEAGELMTEVGEHISAIRVKLNDIPTEGSLTDFIRTLSEENVEPAAALLAEIDLLLDDVDLSGTGFQDKFYDYREKLSALAGVFEAWSEIKEPLLYALGDRYVQHYMVVFMNNNEMRLGGGFMGSFAIVEVNDGRLTDMQFNDIYDYSQQLYEDIPLPAHELEELISVWRLHDANTSPDFPTSAQNIMWLLEKSGGPGVDGVIGVNLTAAEAMLATVGEEIWLPSLNQALTPQDFGFVISTLVEAKTYGATTPKDVLAELIEVFIKSIDDPLAKLNVGLEVLTQSRNKQINFYHENESVQGLLTDLDMAGTLPDLNTLNGDFVMPTFTNVGGNKTDAYVHTALVHDTQLFADGSIQSSFTIRRAHTFTGETLNWLKNLLAPYGFRAWTAELERVMGDDSAETGIRIYLPEDAQLVDTSGIHRDDLQFYYDTELDHSYYYYRQSLEPGTQQEFTLLYTLPVGQVEDFQEYEFQLFKQPGLKNVRYEKTVSSPDSQILSSQPIADENEGGVHWFSGRFKTDLEWRVLRD